MLIFWALRPVAYAGCDRWAGAPSHHRRGNHPIACTPPPAQLLLPLSAISAGLTAAIESAAEEDMQDLAASARSGEASDLRALELDEEELEGHKMRLLDELGDIETAGLIFEAGTHPDHAPGPNLDPPHPGPGLNPDPHPDRLGLALTLVVTLLNYRRSALSRDD